MSDVDAVTGAGDTSSTGGETTELTNLADTGAAGADQGGQGGQGTAEGGASGTEASGAEGAGEGEGTGESGASGQGTAKVDDPVNKRFSEVTRQRDEAQRREREAKSQLDAALEALRKVGGTQTPVTTETKTTPPADDIEEPPEPPEFIDPEQYQRDMATYTQKVVERTTKLQLRAAEANREREATERANRERQVAHAQAWQHRRQKALDEMPDYADVAENPNVHISQTMALAITSSDHGPKLAYHLGQHPDVAERIAKMPDALQLMELGKLEAQITAPKPPQVSKTPPPVKPLTGSGEPQTKSADDMSMEEYAAMRSKRH